MERKGRPISHGMSKSPTYSTWENMKQRCLNPKSSQYEFYGGRGIRICDEWVASFENFLNDMGERPKDSTIDRIDFNGDYTPLNCRWSNTETQARNRRTSKTLILNGESKTLAEWCSIYNIKRNTVNGRLQRGWTIEKALTTKAHRPAKTMEYCVMRRIPLDEGSGGDWEQITVFKDSKAEGLEMLRLFSTTYREDKLFLFVKIGKD
jgi:hypothetical protein